MTYNVFLTKKDGVDRMVTLNYGAASIFGFDLGKFQINASYISQNGIGPMKKISPLRLQSILVGVAYKF